MEPLKISVYVIRDGVRGEAITNSEATARAFADEACADREMLYAFYLDSRNQLIEKRLEGLGTVDFAVVSPREIVKAALMLSASRVILVHNHPSGDPMPSAHDAAITNQIEKALDLFDMKLLDHVIVGARVNGRQRWLSITGKGPGGEF